MEVGKKKMEMAEKCHFWVSDSVALNTGVGTKNNMNHFSLDN